MVISDVHGHLDVLRERLLAHGLLHDGTWAGGDRRLWFLGDYVDRGPEGLGVVELVRRLEVGARASGGRVTPLLGNHELQFLAALHFGERPVRPGSDDSWLSGWRRFGGVDEELRLVSAEQVEWMTRLPLIDEEDGVLLVHSDSDAYLELGRSVAEINAAGRRILSGRDHVEWAFLHQLMTRRGDFLRAERLSAFLHALDGRRVVHGHSPLGGVFGLEPSARKRPHVYADGRATAVDGGVFEGGALIVAEL
jgi:hypothetical protein